MVTIYTPYVSAATESAIEEKIVERENTAQNSTLSEAFFNMRRSLRDELKDVVNTEWVAEESDNSKTIEIKD